MGYRPTIAITGPKKGGFSRFFAAVSVFLAGGKPTLVAPDGENQTKEFDGLIITGGDDLERAFFEEDFCELDEIISKHRDALEYRMLHKASNENKPVMGICRGYQLINIYFGGSLYYDIRKANERLKYSILPWKKIDINSQCTLGKINQEDSLQINTLHHQAVKDPAPGFRVCAKDKEGIIQSIEDKKRGIFGVQWHPEYLLYMPSSFRLFLTLIRRAKSS